MFHLFIRNVIIMAAFHGQQNRFQIFNYHFIDHVSARISVLCFIGFLRHFKEKFLLNSILVFYIRT